MEKVVRQKETYKSIALESFIVTLFASTIFLKEPSLSSYSEWSFNQKLIGQTTVFTVIILLFMVSYYREEFKLFSETSFNFVALLFYFAIATFFIIAYYFYGVAIPLTILVFAISSLLFYFIGKIKGSYE